METYTMQEASKIVGIDRSSISYRMKILGIKQEIKRVKGKMIFLDDEDIDRLLNFEKITNRSLDYNSEFYSRKKLIIVEYFLKNKNNGISTISKLFEVKESIVQRMVNELLENNFEILIGSKINLTKFEKK